MAKKKEADSKVTDIKDLLKKEKLVIGTSVTLKKLKAGKIEKVLLSSNCPENIRNDFESYGRMAKVEIMLLKYPNDELGDICKKPFSISVLGVLKSK